MESIAAPLRRLHEEASWFARATEIRLLHVRTDATMRAGALDVLAAMEHHADNRALFFRFDDPFSGPDRGWPARVERMLLQHQQKIDALAPAGITVQPFGAAGASAEPTARGFSSLLFTGRKLLGAPLDGAVILLAPARVDDGLALRHELSTLLAAPQLPHVRWIVVEADGDSLGELVRALGSRALACDCKIDEQQQQADLAAAGVASVADPPVVLPVEPKWRAPGAMPDVAAPPRRNQPAFPSDVQLREAGLSPKFVKGGGEALKKLVLGGALALRQGRHRDAVDLQSRAAALCAEMEMPREQIINAMVLGGYLLAAAQRRLARETYTKARDLAVTGHFGDLIAQTELALGMVDAVERLPADAAAHYAAAGKHAEQAGVVPLAIECWRMAGQLALDARLETSAVDCWKRALSLADPVAPELSKLTSVAEVARALAALCRRRGLTVQAAALEQRSVDLERGSDTPEGVGRTAAAS